MRIMMRKKNAHRFTSLFDPTKCTALEWLAENAEIASFSSSSVAWTGFLETSMVQLGSL
jgi:hypothetical protein